MRLPTFLEATPPWATLAGGFLFSLTLLLVLTLFGWMYTPLIALALIPLTIGLGLAIVHLIHSKDWTRLTLLLLLVGVAWFNLSGEVPSIFTGRDQGSIAEASWRLAENHQLTWSNPATQAFFDIYGPGTALNFPGFAYTESGALITQFPLGYTAWLAGFVGWLGLSGYWVANGILFIIAGFTFFELLSLFVRRLLATIGTALLSLTFLPIWMLHYTLSEHLALALFLIITYALIRWRDQPTHTLWYVLTLLSASLFIFTRIEGFVVLSLVTFIAIGTRTLRNFLLEKKWLRFILPLVILGFLFLRDFFINLPYYTMIGKAVVKNWQELSLWGEAVATPHATSESIFAIFSLYGLLTLFIVGSFGIILALFKEKRQSLLVLILALPTFVYLIDAHITPDHPWMLRRYYFTLWPTFVFFAILFWHWCEERYTYLRNRRATLFLVTAIVFIHFAPAWAVWQMDEHTPLLGETARLAERVSGHDLLLVDRLASGDPFRLLSGPLSFLFGKQAVYFFNPEDLDRLPLDTFERVFLLTSHEQSETLPASWSERLIERETFLFSSATVTAQDHTPQNTIRETQATLFELKR